MPTMFQTATEAVAFAAAAEEAEGGNAWVNLEEVHQYFDVDIEALRAAFVALAQRSILYVAQDVRFANRLAVREPSPEVFEPILTPEDIVYAKAALAAKARKEPLHD